MPASVNTVEEIGGLTSLEIPALREQFGRNVFRSAAQHRYIRIIIDIIKEPMFILLLVACVLYFILGSTTEGFMMAAAIMIVSAISIFQEAKSSRALAALEKYTEPKVIVIRDRKEQVVPGADLVPGDLMLLEEGMRVPADAIILQSNDLSLDESLITGESLPVEKRSATGKEIIYQGTTINSGKCIAKVTATGNNTVLGKIGKSIDEYTSTKTLLQQQVNHFVRRLAFFGLAGFVVILAVNYFHYGQWVTSLLFALTLAMSAVPEEIPVAFSSFMALGAYKMSKLGIISRQPQVIENLGAINVLCLDKTGTITENRMQVKAIYHFDEDRLVDIEKFGEEVNDNVLLYAVLASETNPFDAMEKAIWQAYMDNGGKKHEGMQMIHEYPLEGQPPMMTHVYQINGQVLATAKGAAERILAVCRLDENNKRKVIDIIQQLASNGWRVLGVAKAIHTESHFPAGQDDFNWQLVGLLALYDPPKKNAKKVLKNIYNAGINVKLVTGDHPQTAINIAEQTGIANPQQYCTGGQVMEMSDESLQNVSKTTTVFARMFPEAKLKLINALRANGNIVAMTGDGVNDGPALKAADIGIAMGYKGTETARRASDLILTDDNLEKIEIAVREGRKIFSNLVKSIRYIIAIHIPIILTASLPLLLGWKFPNIFTPIHVIVMELIMAPTCSIFFENEPVENPVMLTAPRDRSAGLFTKNELMIAITQGLVITAGVLLLYYVFMQKGFDILETRTIVFTTLITSNLFLTFTDRSNTRTIFYTVRYKNNLVLFVILFSVAFLSAIHFIPGVQAVFGLKTIAWPVFWLCVGVSFVSVMWFELYKVGRQNSIPAK
jgi:Ca2+-transporting ATPase